MPHRFACQGSLYSQYLGPKSHSDPPVWSYCFLLIPTLNVWGNKTSFVGRGVLSLLWPCHSSSFLSNWSVPSVPLHTAISPRRPTAPPETVSRAFVWAAQKLLHQVSSNSEQPLKRAGVLNFVIRAILYVKKYNLQGKWCGNK